MTIEELAQEEAELHSFVLYLYRKEETPELYEILKGIFILYKEVHKNYSNLAKHNDEALKRGLFIQWYAGLEPNFLTGIGELDEKAELNIIKIIDEKIQHKNLDDELVWMLKYYAHWDYLFDRYKKEFKGLSGLILKAEGIPSDLVVDKEKMAQRGQMGKYFFGKI